MSASQARRNIADVTRAWEALRQLFHTQMPWQASAVSQFTPLMTRKRSYR